jgi:hypothetical protein
LYSATAGVGHAPFPPHLVFPLEEPVFVEHLSGQRRQQDPGVFPSGSVASLQPAVEQCSVRNVEEFAFADDIYTMADLVPGVGDGFAITGTAKCLRSTTATSPLLNSYRMLSVTRRGSTNQHIDVPFAPCRERAEVQPSRSHKSRSSSLISNQILGRN